MSGTNPFRRKDNVETSQPQRIPSTAGADLTGRAELRFPAIDTDVPKTSKGKTVRIVSPHYSRSKEAYDSTVITSPPPQTPVASPPADTDAPSEEPSPVDPFSAQSDEGTSQDDDDNLRRNTIANAATSAVQDSPLLGTPVKPRKAPALQFGGDASTFASREQTEPSSSTPNVNRPHYDVDDFKRLLLTGERLPTEKNASVTTPSAQVQGLQLGDSNSNTDASSVSRQSIFEPQPEVHPESPSTSMDVPLSDDENHGLVQSLSNSGRPRPSVPPSRHGKLVKQKMPLTVAFESLSSSPPGPSLKSPSLAEPSLPPTPSTSRDLNKPLPPPPRTASPTSMEPSSLDATEAADKPSTPSTLQGRVVSKRNPPALPAARHHGQVRSRSSTTESNRSTSISEELSKYRHPSPTNSSSTTSSKPPPLPPPRRAGTSPAQEHTNPSSGPAPVTDSKEPPASKPRPPVPPSRTPSTTSIKRLSRISTDSGLSGAAPPPPPRRRRGSSLSQSSFTPSRLSGEYRVPSDERARSGSGASSTQQPSVPETQTEERDVIADLTALQREVDELRGKFGR